MLKPNPIARFTRHKENIWRNYVQLSARDETLVPVLEFAARWACGMERRLDHFGEPLDKSAVAQATTADPESLTPDMLDMVVHILWEVDWLYARMLVMWYRTPIGQDFRVSLDNARPAVVTIQPSTSPAS
ncbi:MAG: hypothetical protein WCV82_00635 [Candidatus Paceibacterota bacterium]